jgi:hypothetical protein
MTPTTAIRRFRITLAAFIVGLLISGLTAFPLLAEIRVLSSWLGLNEERFWHRISIGRDI